MVVLDTRHYLEEKRRLALEVLCAVCEYMCGRCQGEVFGSDGESKVHVCVY